MVGGRIVHWNSANEIDVMCVMESIFVSFKTTALVTEITNHYQALHFVSAVQLKKATTNYTVFSLLSSSGDCHQRRIITSPESSVTEDDSQCGDCL